MAKCGKLWRRWQTFIVVVTFTLVIDVVMIAYTDASLPDLEKQFRLRSSESGLLVSARLIGGLPLVVFASYICGRWRVPRVISVAYTVQGLMCLLIASTHFIVTSYETNKNNHVTSTQSPSELSIKKCKLLSQHTNHTPDYTFQQFCDISPPTPEHQSGDRDTPAYVVFFMAMVVLGVCDIPLKTVLMSYMEDIVPKRLFPLAMGIQMAVTCMGYLLGSSLAGWTNSLYVSLDKNTSIQHDDPSWIGAWWLGYVLIGGWYLINGPIMCLFPSDLDTTQDGRRDTDGGDINDGDGEYESSDNDDVTGEKYRLKDLPATMKRLATNKIYVVFLVVYMLHSVDTSSFQFKYFVSQFRVPNWKANLMSGTSGLVSVGLANIIGGLVVSGLRLDFSKTVYWLFGVMSLLTAMLVPTMFVHCDLPPVFGVNSTIADVYNTCNTRCNCTLEAYTPVCDQNITYFSACHAGCSGLSNLTAANHTSIPRTYADCECTETGTAVEGLCPTTCPVWLAFFLLFVVGDFMGGLTDSPESTNILRSVEKRDKSVAMGTKVLTSSLVGVASPSVIGAIIDSSCLVWGENSVGSRENCWIYDFTDNRFKYTGTNLVATGLTAVMFGVACVITRRKRDHVILADDEDGDTQGLIT